MELLEQTVGPTGRIPGTRWGNPTPPSPLLRVTLFLSWFMRPARWDPQVWVFISAIRAQHKTKKIYLFLFKINKHKYNKGINSQRSTFVSSTSVDCILSPSLKVWGENYPLDEFSKRGVALRCVTSSRPYKALFKYNLVLVATKWNALAYIIRLRQCILSSAGIPLSV